MQEKNRANVRKHIFIVFFIGLLVISGVSSGCKTEGTSRTNTTQLTEDNVLLRLSTDNKVYSPGEIIVVEASVENLTPEPVEYTLYSKGNPFPGVHLESNSYFEGFSLYERGGEPSAVLPVVTMEQLEPHEKVTREVVWDQKFKGVQAPEGSYSISAGITLGDYYQGEEFIKNVSVNLEIQISGAPQWISQEEAIDIAVNVPEVSEWRELHSGKNLVKEENGDFYLLLTGEWIRISSDYRPEDLSLSEFNDWVPGVFVELKDEIWLVSTGTKYGMPPYFVEVRIDPESGSVLDVQFNER